MSPGVPPSSPPSGQVEHSTAVAQRKARPLFRLLWFVAVASAAGIVGITVGEAWSSPDVRSTAVYEDLAAKLDLTSRELTTVRRELSAVESAAAPREIAAGSVEEPTPSSRASDGFHEVGVDIMPGPYRTDGGPGCYFAIYRAPDSRSDVMHVVHNGLTDGPAVVLVNAGQGLELACNGAGWVLQR